MVTSLAVRSRGDFLRDCSSALPQAAVANMDIVLACPEAEFLYIWLMPTKKAGLLTGFLEQLDKQSHETP